MANADADRISLDSKFNFAAIAAARRIPHLELLCPFLMAISRTTRGHGPAMSAVDSGRPLRANTGYSSSAWRTSQIARSKPLAWASATAFPTSVLRACHLAARLALI
jgi:hypothetical protein